MLNDVLYKTNQTQKFQPAYPNRKEKALTFSLKKKKKKKTRVAHV